MDHPTPLPLSLAPLSPPIVTSFLPNSPTWFCHATLKTTGLNSQFYVFEQLDSDSDGKVSVGEFMAMFGSKVSWATVDLRSVFNSIDTDGSGSVDAKELKKALARDKTLVERCKVRGECVCSGVDVKDFRPPPPRVLSSFTKKQ